MSRFQDKPLYGRNDELAYLQGIASSVLHEGDFVIDIPSSVRNRYGCSGDCNCTEPTEGASHSDDDDDCPVHSCEDEEIESIHVFDRQKTNKSGEEGGSYQFVLVSGPPGIGKRSLVTTALRQCRSCEHKSPFLFVSARFQSSVETSTGTTIHRNVPFITMTEAFQEMAVMLSQQCSDLQSAIQHHLRGVLANPEDIRALCDLIPAVKQWFSQESLGDSSNTKSATGRTEQEPASVSGLQSAVHQLQVWFPVLQMFLRAVVNVVPVVFLLEDVQYSDETSRKLIQSLMQHNWADESNGLLLLATYSNDDDVAFSSTSLLSFLGSSDSSIDCDWKPIASSPNILVAEDLHRIQLSELTWDDVREWIQDCDVGVISQCSVQQRDAMADLVFRKSNGNPLLIRFLLHFLLQDESLLQEPIHKKQVPKEVDHLFKSVFVQQEEAIQKAVQVAALIAKYSGGEVHHDMLEIAVNAPCEDIVETAQWLGFFEYASTRPTVYFFRDSFQKAVLDTISDPSLLCLEIGRRIWSSAILCQDKKEVSDEEVQARVLLSTQLLRSCIELLSDIDERIYMSQLCYEAGQKSSSRGSFYTSVKLFEFAIDVLGTELWRSDLYEASLVLHNGAAQAYCNIADYENMRRTLDAIFDNAITFQDKLPAYLMKIYSSGLGHQLLETSRISTMVLQELGEPVSEHPSNFTVVSHLLKVKWALRGKSDRFLINLPMADDPDFLVVAQLLSFTQFIGFMAFPARTALILYRSILSALKHGICGPSALAFPGYAFLLCATGNFEEGNRMGQMSLRMAERFGAWWPRLHILVYGYVNHWTYPLRDSLEPLKRIQRASLLFGDLEVYGVSSSLHLLTSFNAGVLLDVLEPASRTKCFDLAAIGQTNQLMMAIQIWNLVNDLQGGRSKKLELNGSINDANSSINHCIKEGNKFMAGNYYICQTIWYYFIGDYEQALHMAKKSLEQRNFFDIAQTFYQGLASVAAAWTFKSCLHDKHFALGKKTAKCIKRWAEHCPENFRNKQLLLEAEIAALRGKTGRAVSLFEQSIEKSKQEGFIHEEAIAYERLGHFQHRVGNAADAKICFSNASSAYQKWGASVLVDRMGDLLVSTCRSS